MDSIMGKGLHLLVEGISNKGMPKSFYVTKFITNLIDSIGMALIFGPVVRHPMDRPIAAIAILAESHVSLHWTPKGAVYLDIFSCKEFDIDSVVLWITAELELEEGVYRSVRRGWEYGPSEAVLPILTRKLPVLPRYTTPTEKVIVSAS